MTKAPSHKWAFKGSFRRHAFGWRSQPAVQRVKQAVAEITRVAREDPILAGEGAVTFLERVAPALENVDSSSGAVGSAVNRAITELVPIIAIAPGDARTRWLERLWAAHEADHIPYIESLSDSWGELCASKEVASAWADRLLAATREALQAEKGRHVFFHGTSACLSALHRAERYAEILNLLERATFWPYMRWAVKSVAAQGNPAEAIRRAESCPDGWNYDIAEVCEEILLGCGLVDEAYKRYAVAANGRETYVGTFKAIVAKYPHKSAHEILADLAKPGDEGKWFAAAKEAGLYDEALELAARSPCDPRTLTRAARDFADKQPAFAVGAGLLALHWLVHGHSHEITAVAIKAAYANTMAAAEKAGTVGETRQRIRDLAGRGGGFVRDVLARELGP